MPRSLLSPRWVLVHLLAALIVSVCVALGQWQLNRLSERRAENARIARQTAVAPEGLDELLPTPRLPYRHAEDLAYRRVNVRGTYDADREVVLLTRSNGEQTGNHVLTPLVTTQGSAVIVDRGWVPLTMDSPPVPEAAPPDGPVEVTGLLMPSEPRGRFEPRVSQSGTVRAMSRIDLTRLSKQLPYQTYPLYLRLETQLPTSGRRLPETVPLPAPSDGPHLPYAIQWFSFGSIALITYGALIRREFQNRRLPTSDSLP